MSATDPTRRYFDNAATSHPKPPGVAEAVQHYFTDVYASAGRGAYREAAASGNLLLECRDALRRLLGARPDDHVIFTLNGTDALNLAIKAVVRPGAHVVTTCMDHNSVLRPLSALEEQAGVRWTAVGADPQSTRVAPDAIVAALRPETRLVAMNHASNVTGALQPLAEIADVCAQRGVLLLVDAAQSAGHVPIDFAGLGADLLAAPGHKGLLGPLGTGLLLIRNGVQERMRTVREGGTGSQSEQPRQPEALPDRFEAGSHNGPGIAGWLAALRWVEGQGVEALRAHEWRLCEVFAAGLDRIPGVTWYGPRPPEQRVGVFSMRVEGLDPHELAAMLESRYELLTRAGLHCAPLAHQTIGTLSAGGTTRFSCGPFTRRTDVEFALTAIAEVAGAARPTAGLARCPE